MSQNDTLITLSQLPISEIVKLIGIVIATIGGIIGIIILLVYKFIPFLKKLFSQRSLLNRIDRKLYAEALIKNSLKLYIYPNCQSLDPAGGNNPKFVISTESDLFKKMDDILKNPSKYKYVIFLADSGMGKTSFLLNYYLRYLRYKHTKFIIELMNLGTGDIDQKISKIGNKEKTVLFLDALDEDALAINNHVQRIKDLAELTKDFLKIVITCRTQFFPTNEEITRETGLLKSGPRKLGESNQFTFHKIYLSPFNDEQVKKYIKRRYNILQVQKRMKAFKIVEKIPTLVIRPMVLSYIDLLIDKGTNIKYSFQLYEEIVTTWIKQEVNSFKGIKKETLREFCNKLAINLHENKVKRKGEKIPISEIKKLAIKWGINIDLLRLTGRSLLYRDAEGNYKLSHQSVLEYLVAYSILKGEYSELQITEQIEPFLSEMIVSRLNKNEPILSGIIQKVIKRPVLIQNEGFNFGMVLLQPDEFLFGERNNKVKKRIEKPFAICIYPVTQSLYKKVIGKNPSRFIGDDLPVESVSWFEAVEFCNKLSEYTGLRKVYTINGEKISIDSDANGYRLPLEVEWEYACRAGITGERYNELDEIGWYNDNSEGKTHPVGQKRPNDFGLYDMLGNVWEWCNDWHTKEDCRVLRGGSLNDNAENCRFAFRGRDYPEDRSNDVGFRFARGHIENKQE